jgi:hypothetical protein
MFQAKRLSESGKAKLNSHSSDSSTEYRVLRTFTTTIIFSSLPLRRSSVGVPGLVRSKYSVLRSASPGSPQRCARYVQNMAGRRQVRITQSAGDVRRTAGGGHALTFPPAVARREDGIHPREMVQVGSGFGYLCFFCRLSVFRASAQRPAPAKRRGQAKPSCDQPGHPVTSRACAVCPACCSDLLQGLWQPCDAMGSFCPRWLESWCKGR